MVIVMKRLLGSCLFLLYDLTFITGLVFYLPFYFLRKKITFCSLKEKLGFIRYNCRNSIWIHAVSVGEVNLIEPLVRKLEKVLNLPIIISTTTLTGRQAAEKKYSDIARVLFFPLDISFAFRRVILKLKPQAVIAVETELWPNLIRFLNKKGIPFLIINGRISDQAFRRYRFLRFLMKNILPACRCIGAQSLKDRKRFLYLGAVPGRVLVTGNLKFNIVAPDRAKLIDYEKKYSAILKAGQKLLFIAASTHHPEEEMVLDICRKRYLKNRLSLLIAPRHPGRAVFLQKLAVAKGFTPLLMSRFNSERGSRSNVFILDTIGQLFYFYNLADICFVGGSFSASGGHNILEPIYFSKPVIFGPSMENFIEIAKIALNNSAAIQVNSRGQLQEELLSLLKDKQKRLEYAGACAGVFREAKGLDQNLEIILKELKR